MVYKKLNNKKSHTTKFNIKLFLHKEFILSVKFSWYRLNLVLFVYIFINFNTLDFTIIAGIQLY